MGKTLQDFIASLITEDPDVLNEIIGTWGGIEYGGTPKKKRVGSRRGGLKLDPERGKVVGPKGEEIGTMSPSEQDEAQEDREYRFKHRLKTMIADELEAQIDSARKTHGATRALGFYNKIQFALSPEGPRTLPKDILQQVESLFDVRGLPQPLKFETAKQAVWDRINSYIKRASSKYRQK